MATSSGRRVKLIIDTDPGIDDALAILMACASDNIELLGLTTCFGNVPTSLATQNALSILERCGRTEVPVVGGSDAPLNGSSSKRIADFVHGRDGLGEADMPAPTTKPLQGVTAAEFILQCCREQPGEVTYLAIGNLTNLALALQTDPSLDGLLKQVVFMGGAFRVNGNVNPAAEANTFSDADASDFVMRTCTKMTMLALDATHLCYLTNDDIESLRGRGRHGDFAWAITQFYKKYHKRAYEKDIIYLHDPAALLVVTDPSVVTEWHSGAVAVATDGIMKGHSILDHGKKNWMGTNPWIGRPPVKVGLSADGLRVRHMVLELLAK